MCWFEMIIWFEIVFNLGKETNNIHDTTVLLNVLFQKGENFLKRLYHFVYARKDTTNSW